MSHNSAKRIAKDATELAVLKLFMEAMMSEIWRVMKLELKQVHERIDQMESAHEKLQNASNVRRRERVQPREVRVEDEEPYGTGFGEEDDRDSVVAFDTDDMPPLEDVSAEEYLAPNALTLVAGRALSL
ncbi:hypothetical protein F0562_001724 [Nyssa sinensis]|uniref:Uncharacterized protein n=1 Tax=Nyssa sinensis TaxID=561372 RepID=A0A5J5C7T1_9ASTE|nr:hypothetical protein F0562_001724 [Nyssa sinensis]